MKKIILLYLLGTVGWFVLLACLPLTQGPTNLILVAFYYLTLGLFLGLYGRRLLERHRWFFIVIPFVSLVATLLVREGRAPF